MHIPCRRTGTGAGGVRARVAVGGPLTRGPRAVIVVRSRPFAPPLSGGPMRPLLLLACLLLIGLIVPTWSAEIKTGPLAPTAKKEGKERPQNVPGPFHPYNVNERKKTPEEEKETDFGDMDKDKEKDKF